jgi:putative transposase
MDTGFGKPPRWPKRRSIRLREHDYSQNGAYFVTVCVSNRECLLGEIEGGGMLMNRYGLATALTFEWLKDRYVTFYTKGFKALAASLAGGE